jgi:UDP-N-acetylglucosamine 1-carboxyvinyltransferase
VVAGLVADGFTSIDSIHFIERGYEDFDKKMTALGACMKKIPVDDERELQKFKMKVS